jgi:hypothetical protein
MAMQNVDFILVFETTVHKRDVIDHIVLSRLEIVLDISTFCSPKITWLVSIHVYRTHVVPEGYTSMCEQLKQISNRLKKMERYERARSQIQQSIRARRETAARIVSQHSMYRCMVS